MISERQDTSGGHLIIAPVYSLSEFLGHSTRWGPRWRHVDSLICRDKAGRLGRPRGAQLAGQCVGRRPAEREDSWDLQMIPLTTQWSMPGRELPKAGGGTGLVRGEESTN